MLSGWLPENSYQNPEDVAKDCYCTLFKDTLAARKRQFLDGKILSYGTRRTSIRV
jgi:hypothetical protein